jgi:hypothetical protein
MFQTTLKTAKPVPVINRDLLRVRHIQAHVRQMAEEGSAPISTYLGSPMLVGPFMVPITRYVE